MVHEWIEELEDPDDYSSIVREINARGQSVLVHSIDHVNIEIIWEIYVNSKQIEDTMLDLMHLCAWRYEYDDPNVDSYFDVLMTITL